ncbi:MAG: transposase domain-containing protein, partial [Mesorhizobium sp.]
QGNLVLPAPEEICKLNAVDPQAYLTTTLTAIVNGHKRRRIDELLPWNDPLE